MAKTKQTARKNTVAIVAELEERKEVLRQTSLEKPRTKDEAKAREAAQKSLRLRLPSLKPKVFARKAPIWVNELRLKTLLETLRNSPKPDYKSVETGTCQPVSQDRKVTDRMVGHALSFFLSYPVFVLEYPLDDPAPTVMFAVREKSSTFAEWKTCAPQFAKFNKAELPPEIGGDVYTWAPTQVPWIPKLLQVCHPGLLDLGNIPPTSKRADVYLLDVSWPQKTEALTQTLETNRKILKILGPSLYRVDIILPLSLDRDDGRNYLKYLLRSCFGNGNFEKLCERAVRQGCTFLLPTVESDVDIAGVDKEKNVEHETI